MDESKFLARGIVILLVLLLQLFSGSVHSQNVTVILMDKFELSALRQLWFAWNQSTPAPESNLAGWRTYNFDSKYDYSNSSYAFIANDDPCFGQQWRGLICALYEISESEANRTIFIQPNATKEPNIYYNARVTGLVLNDVSIRGVFPQDDTSYATTSLSLVIITGNPDLTGAIPNLTSTPIKVFDLHNNGFNGSFPWQGTYPGLEYLDISNNKFTGGFRTTGSIANRLRTLILSHNNFSGGIDESYDNNWMNPQSDALDSPLSLVDLSYNKFSGRLSNLSNAIFLNTLNVSHNLLSGEISATMFNSSGMGLFRVLDLSYNKFNGSIPNLSTSLYALETLDLSWNEFSPAPFPQGLKGLGKLLLLGLSGINMTGEFNPSVLNNLTSLKTLLLDNNTINGTLDIGGIYSNIGNRYKTLQLVSMRNNNITNVTSNFPETVTKLGSTIIFNLHGNPYCHNSSGGSDLQRCVCDGYCIDTKNEVIDIATKKSITKVIIIATILSTVLMAVVICTAAIFFYKNRKEKHDLLLAVHERFAEYEMKPTLFAYSELQRSTRNFHVDMKLGQGGYGTVYKSFLVLLYHRDGDFSILEGLYIFEGQLLDGSTVAIKQLLTSTQQTMDDFLNEVVLLTSAKHRNLVKLKGCCLRGQQRLLVYEYMEKHDLADILFDREGNQILLWPTRLNICLGVARGLHYLHALVEPKIIHRDIKASNILLDKNAQAKIADFGLAMLFPDEETHIITIHVAGTKGYLAPEYATLGQVSEKIDVFSFGVLVLEVISGRRNIDLSYPIGKAYLAEWAWNCSNEGKLLDLVDPTLVLQSDEEVQVQKVINIALLCMQTAPERRPTMAQVVAMLQGDMEVGLVENIFDFDSSSTTIFTDSKETGALVPNSSSSMHEIMGMGILELGTR